MNSERWRKIQGLYQAARECSPGKRDAFLADACGGDEELKLEIGSLLAQDSRDGNLEPAELLTAPVTVSMEQGASPGQYKAIDGQSVTSFSAGRYELRSLLGRGGMGAVYLGFDTQLGRQVAIKVLPEATAQQQSARERLLREAQAAAALNHPGICAIYSIEKSEDLLFLVLEHIQGHSFRDLLDNAASGWPPEPRTAAGYILQVAEALLAAHAAGIVHRDIKSSNLMLSPAGQVKVLDFGLAQMSGAKVLTEGGNAVGTPAYASPEQIRGEPIDARTDLWSLGVVFYEVLTGRRPFSGDSMASVIHAVLDGEPRPIRGLCPAAPAPLARVIGKLLTKNPERRYASARALIQELRPLALASPPYTAVSAPETGIEARLGRAERRTITFLHIELAPVSSDLDPEDFQTALERSRAVCAKVVERYSGWLQPLIGNAGIALFGYPEAREDAVRLAVEAGLVLAEAFARGHSGFCLRAGVDTSLAVAEAGGAISGEGFDLARALAQRAGANEVLIADGTARNVEGLFEFAQGEELQLAGGRLLKFRRVLHASTAHSRFQAMLRTGHTPLAGRDQELELLLRHWQGAMEGRGHVTLLGAAPGLGKSRLAYELKQRVALNPAAALIECYCAPQYANSALYPVIDCLERLWFESETRAMEPGEKLKVIEGVLAEQGFPLAASVPLFAELLNVPAPAYPVLEMTSERRRSQTLQALANMVIERAARQPLLLIVEDLHWADPTTLELLRLLIDQTAAASLMSLYTHRPEYVSAWPQRSHISSISLDRLSPADSLAVAASVARGTTLDPGTLEQIVANSDGVPLFLEEMTKPAAEFGAGSTRSRNLPVPATLRDSFISRLDQLGAPRNLARIASVLGREFPQALLEALSGLSPEELQESLDTLVDSEILYVRGVAQRRTYIFKHALLQNAAYDSLLKKARLTLHQQAAELLVNRFPELAARQPEVVAGHFTEAGRGEQAIEYWYRAGISALQRSAHLEAISHCERGLAVYRSLPADRSNPAQELLLLSAFGPALLAARGFGANEAGEAYRRAEELLPPDGTSPRTLATLSGVSEYNLVSGHLDHALLTVLRMIDTGSRLNDDAMRLEGHWMAGNTLFWMGDLMEALRHLEEAEAIYDPARFGDHGYRFGQDPLVSALCLDSFVQCFLGFFNKAIATADRAVEFAQSIRHPFSIGWSLAFRATLDCFTGNFAGALMWGDRGVRYCQEQAHPFWLSAAMSACGIL